MNNNNVAKYENWFRQATPLFLLGLLLVVLLESWLFPEGQWVKDTFGDQVILKGAVVFLIGYVLLLWGESLRLHGLLTGLLEAFKAFDRDQAGGGGGQRSAKAERAARDPRARLEAAKLLLAAMASDDESIRETSHHNLVRLVGTDLGKDPAKWQGWLAEQSKS